MFGLVAGILLAGTLGVAWLQRSGVPGWAETNTGPWLVAAAALAFSGVLVTVVVQGVIASIANDNARALAEADRKSTAERTDIEQRRFSEQAAADREHTLNLAREERNARAEHSERQWFREQRLAAYTRFMAAFVDFNLDRRSGIKRTTFINCQIRASTVSDQESVAFLSHVMNLTLGLYDGKYPDETDFGPDLLAHCELWLTDTISEQSEDLRRQLRISHIVSFGTFAEKVGFPLYADLGATYNRHKPPTAS